MVAITVILAAVIASFVLGLGDSADEVQPNTSFTFDYDNVTSTGDGEGNVTVTLSDGESLADNEVFIRGEQLNQTGQLSTLTGISVTDNEWSAGESIEIGVTDNDYVLNVVWESEDSDDSSRLQTDRGPEA
jgi:FlaG/FlaF family flagellin (archaellin)